jgi:hypothetical protein
LQSNGGEAPGLKIGLEVDDCELPVEIDYIDWEAHSKSMNTPAGLNPETTSVTEVILGDSEQSA